ncbi:MAG TPA: DUF3806 domain-containing protein [Rhizomicrobium sp.]|jgi:hypothetical protein|nr:DUF3806 domain-containing protein [Rhizomicrobium sp.]
MTDDQRIEPLSSDLAAHTEKQREWVREHFTAETREEYNTIEGKLRLLDTILSSKWIGPAEKWKLQSLGVAFGDALAQMFNLEWVSVTDEYGTDPALRYPHTTILVYPLTVISKRIEDGEEMEVRDLFSKFCERIEHLARYGPPADDGPLKSEEN